MQLDEKTFLPQVLFKRDGSEVLFDLGKIERAIDAAGQASGEFIREQVRALSDAVHARLIPRIRLTWSGYKTPWSGC